YMVCVQHSCQSHARSRAHGFKLVLFLRFEHCASSCRTRSFLAELFCVTRRECDVTALGDRHVRQQRTSDVLCTHAGLCSHDTDRKPVFFAHVNAVEVVVHRAPPVGCSTTSAAKMSTG